MGFEENQDCHFLPINCRFPFPEEAFKEALEDPDSDPISQVPLIDSELCTNCLLGFAVEAIRDLSSSRTRARV